MKRTTAALLVTAAVFVPAASARPLEPVGVPLPASSVASWIQPATQPAASSSRGFDWGDAGVGAAVFALLSLGGGAVVVARRGRVSSSAIS
jgi:hypothetical protein